MERATRLDALAASDPELVREARALVAADGARTSERFEEAVAERAARLLASAALAPETSAPVPPGPAAAVAGLELGPWRLVRPLGAGGMAEVWEAERIQGAFEQRVAVKLLKRGMDSEEIVRRFLRERQILARLEHPGIARLYDGGLAPDGRPYFVMEKIDGEPITSWCAARALDLAGRLRLLVACCRAVAAAHRQLVVHRDLKPSNILVTGEGEVKLLDFGIAKLLADDGAGAEEATRAEMRVLTPAYAAPEQILGEPVSTATDVYALGVLAYELLSGRLPHRRLGRRAAELASEIAGESIARPSSVVLEPGRAEAGAPEEGPRARRRRARALAGDLDTIVLTALRREPERRYPSVDALATDLERYLAGLPIAARADSLGYRTRKFVRRHRVAVAAAALVVLALVGGIAATAWQAERARANAAVAAANAHRAERVKEFLIGLFEVADPEQSGGGAVTAADLLDQAGRRLPHELASEPAIQAELLESVARIERSLGRFETAERLAGQALALRAARPGDDAGRGSALATLGAVLLGQGRLDEAEPKLAEGLALLERSTGPDSLATARARSDHAAVAFWRERLAESEAAERVAWEAYRRELGDENVQTAIHLRNLGVLAYQQNHHEDAERDLRASQAVLERQLGPDHPALAHSYANLAALLDSRGRPQESEPLYRRSVAIRRRELGDSHPATGQSLQLLGVFLLSQRRWTEAEAVQREALAIFRAIDPHHFEVGKLLHGLATGAAGRGRPDEAERLFGESIAILREKLGADHPFVWVAQSNRARQIGKLGRLDEAETLLRESHARIAASFAPDNEYVADVETRLGEVLRARGALDEALAVHRHALESLVKIYGERHLKVADARMQVAADLAAQRAPYATEADAARAVYRELDPTGARAREAEELLARAAG